MRDHLRIDLPERWAPDNFLELVYVQENEATWRILASVNDEKEFVAKLHGGFFALLPLLAGVIGFDTIASAGTFQVMAYVTAGLGVLTILSFRSYIDCDILRLQQQELGKAAEIARWLLADGRTTYFTVRSPRDSGASRLAVQRDPVANDTKTVLLLSALDLVALLAASCVILLHRPGVPLWVTVPTALTIVGVAVWATHRATQRRWAEVDRAIRQRTAACLAASRAAPEASKDASNGG